MIFLYICVLIPQQLTAVPHPSQDLLDRGFIDKIIKSQLIWVLELKLVVVGQEAHKTERPNDVGWFFYVVYVLNLYVSFGIKVACKPQR